MNKEKPCILCLIKPDFFLLFAASAPSASLSKSAVSGESVKKPAASEPAKKDKEPAQKKEVPKKEPAPAAPKEVPRQDGAPGIHFFYFFVMSQSAFSSL